MHGSLIKWMNGWMNEIIHEWMWAYVLKSERSYISLNSFDCKFVIINLHVGGNKRYNNNFRQS